MLHWVGAIVAIGMFGAGPVDAADRSGNLASRLAGVEVLLGNLAMDAALTELTVWDEELKAWRELSPADFIAAARYRDWIAEMRFLAALFDATEEGEPWRERYRANPRANLERFLADGSTITAALELRATRAARRGDDGRPRFCALARAECG
jgi:hypothetical protein